MAALCLAQLKDEVLRITGALQMDSLFIDEVWHARFRLPVEVTDAMSARQDGDRMIRRDQPPAGAD